MSDSAGSGDALRYPIGRFVRPETISAGDRERWLEQVRTAPARLAEVARSLSPEQLDTPYREGGWTARQVIHHVPDSHMQAYARTKLALTEDEPTIKPYREAEWARLGDTESVPVETSLLLLESLHQRWTAVLVSLTDEQWKRCYRHPEMGLTPLESMLALYAWHGDHHIGHIRSVAERRT